MALLAVVVILSALVAYRLRRRAITRRQLRGAAWYVVNPPACPDLTRAQKERAEARRKAKEAIDAGNDGRGPEASYPLKDA